MKFKTIICAFLGIVLITPSVRAALQEDELLGQHAVLAQAFLYRRLVDFELLPLYAGLSAEFGNVFPTRSAIRLSDGIAAACSWGSTRCSARSASPTGGRSTAAITSIT